MIIENPCKLATLSIDPAILSSTALSYDIGEPAHLELLDVALVTSSETIFENCPPIEFSITVKDPSDTLDIDVISIDSKSNTLSIQTSELEKAGTTALLLQAQYEEVGYEVAG